jgi:hypothetical protein
MGKFNLDTQFELYLQRVRLAHIDKKSVQYIELKRAFMGCAGQLLIMFRDDISELEESLLQQTEKFWIEQMGTPGPLKN